MRDPIENLIHYKKIFRTLIWLIPLGVLANVVFSLIKTDPSVFQTTNQLSCSYLGLALILTLVPWFPDALKVMLWTRFLNHQISYKDSLTIVIGSELGSAISPTAIGGGYMKMGLLVEKGFPAGMAASIMVLGSLEMGLFFGLAIPISVVISKAYRFPVFTTVIHRFSSRIHSLPVLIFLAVLGIVLLLLVFYKPFRIRLQDSQRFQQLKLRAVQFLHDFSVIYKLIIRRGKWQLCLTLLLTAIQWTCKYMVISALIAFLNVPVHPVLFFLLQWAVFWLGFLVPTPGGTIGVEAAFFFVFTAFIPESVIGVAAALWRFFTFYLLLILDALLFILLHAKAKKRNVSRYKGVLVS